MKSDSHILFLTPGFPQDEQDGTCIPPFQSYLKCLRREHPGWRISVIAFQYPFFKKKYLWQGIEVHALGGANRRGLHKPRLWRRALRLANQINAAHPVRAIHSLWLQECCWLGSRLARQWNCRHVSTLQGQDALPSNKWLRRLHFEHARVVAISDKGRAQMTESLGSRPVPPVDVLPWGLSEEDLSWENNGADRPIDVLGVGNLVPVKHFACFLETLALLKAEYPGLRACLVGEGPERAGLEAQARQFGLEVDFRGPLPREEVLELMARSKVLLHTARYEGQGYVFPEALSRGMHLVSTPVGMARGMDKWRLASLPASLAAETLHFLNSPVDWEARSPLSMRSTVEGYVGIYQS